MAERSVRYTPGVQTTDGRAGARWTQMSLKACVRSVRVSSCLVAGVLTLMCSTARSGGTYRAGLDVFDLWAGLRWIGVTREDEGDRIVVNRGEVPAVPARYYPPPAAVRSLTDSARLSEFGRSSKCCQCPDSAAREIPMLPVVRSNPRARCIQSRPGDWSTVKYLPAATREPAAGAAKAPARKSAAARSIRSRNR